MGAYKASVFLLAHFPHLPFLRCAIANTGEGYATLAMARRWTHRDGLIVASPGRAQEPEAQRLIEKLPAPQLVTAGFIRPPGVHFIDKKLWVTDINSDLSGGMREPPDGLSQKFRHNSKKAEGEVNT